MTTRIVSPVQRFVAVVTAVIALVALTTGPAAAKSSFMSRTSGVAADAWFQQVDGTPMGGQFGNVHFGSLYAYELSSGRGAAFLYVEDFDCPSGTMPWSSSDEEPGCVWVGSRYGYGENLAFEVASKLSAATLAGELDVYSYREGEEEAFSERWTADVTWTGEGDLAKSSHTFRWTDGSTTYKASYQSTSRSATMSGAVGPMGFDPDSSSGWITQFKSRESGRTK